jgi:hypothetical protein
MLQSRKDLKMATVLSSMRALVDVCLTELPWKSCVWSLPLSPSTIWHGVYLQVNLFTTSMCISSVAGRWTGPRAKDILSVDQSGRQGFGSHGHVIIPVISIKVSSLDLWYTCGITRASLLWFMDEKIVLLIDAVVNGLISISVYCAVTVYDALLLLAWCF